jgi:hypothetical protein
MIQYRLKWDQIEKKKELAKRKKLKIRTNMSPYFFLYDATVKNCQVLQKHGSLLRRFLTAPNLANLFFF